MAENTAKLKEVVGLLAGKNCGKCGYPNCGKFALGLVEGKALPLDCPNSRDNLEALCQALGIAVPQPAASASGQHPGDLDQRHGHHGQHGHSRRGDGNGHIGDHHSGRHGDHHGGRHRGLRRGLFSLF